jgi:hypothetical protein
MPSVWGDRLAEVWAAPGRAGAGVVLGAAGVLTARHVVHAAVAGQPRGSVLGRVVRRGEPAGEWVPLRVRWHDPDWDLALLVVDQSAAEAAAGVAVPDAGGAGRPRRAGV